MTRRIQVELGEGGGAGRNTGGEEGKKQGHGRVERRQRKAWCQPRDVESLDMHTACMGEQLIPSGVGATRGTTRAVTTC